MKDVHRDLMNQSDSYASWHKDPRHKWVHWLLLLVVVFGSIFAFTRALEGLKFAEMNDGNTVVAAAFASMATNKQINDTRRFSEQLIDLNEQRFSASGNTNVDVQMRNIALQRQQNIRDLLKKGKVDEVRSLALSQDQRSDLPPSVQSFVEKTQTIEGTYSHIHGDNMDAGTETHFFSINANNNDYQLYYSNDKDRPAISTGSTVSVEGIVFADEDIVVDNEADNTDVDVEFMADTDGATQHKKIAVIAFNFQNQPTQQPFTLADMKTAIFTAPDSANQFFYDNSYGEWDLVGHVNTDGDVFGWYTIPLNSGTGCETFDNVNWANLADAQAAAAGVDLSPYLKKVYVFPKQSQCSWNGLALVGGARSWLNVISLSQMKTVGTHELGHNFNLYHADSLNCTNGSGLRVPYSDVSGNCIEQSYGDPFDVMGFSTGFKHFNVYHKAQSMAGSTNFLPEANMQMLTPSIGHGTFTLKPHTTELSGTQMLRIDKNASYDYYLEFRQPTTQFGNYTSYQDGINGVTIHLARNTTFADESFLLDMSPLTNTFNDAPLSVGEVYTDPTINLRIETLSVGPDGAQVFVSFDGTTSDGGNTSGTCEHTNPDLNVTALGTNNGANGTTRTYTVVTSNTDTLSCGPGAFTITAVAPTGWVVTPATTSINIGSQAAHTQTVTVTPPTSVVPGNYTVTFTATNTTTGMMATQNMSHLIQGTATTAPAISLSSPYDGDVRQATQNLFISSGLSPNIGSNTETRLYLDGVLVKTCTNTTPCDHTVTASNVSSGVHTVSANVTYTPTGAVSTDTHTFTQLGNTPPPVSAPQITLTSPLEGASVSGNVTLSSSVATSASNASNILSKLYLDGVLQKTCTGGLTCSITLTSVSTGTHVASATAGLISDTSAGLTTDVNTFTKTTDTPPPATVPQVSIPVPSGSNYTFTSDLVIVTGLTPSTPENVQTKIFVDGALKQTCTGTSSCLVTILSSQISLGAHTVSATATNTVNGAVSNASKTVTKIENTPPPASVPAVSVVAPASGTSLSGDLSVTTSLSPNTPAGVQIQVKLDGVVKNTCNNVANCATTIPAATISDGTHTVTAVATLNGSSSTDSNTFTKTTTPPPPPGGSAPQVTLTAPLSGATIAAASNTTITATLPAGQGANTQTKIYLDGMLKHTCSPNLTTCSTYILPTQVSAGTHTASATTTYTPTGQSTTDSKTFTKLAPPPPAEGGVSSGIAPNYITITTPANNSVITSGALTVTASTSAEAIAAGKKILISMNTTGGASWQLALCSTSPCVATASYSSVLFTPGVHTVSAKLMNPLANGGFTPLATTTITVTKQ